MGRLRYPEPDRSYLALIESIEHDIDLIKRSLRIGTDDPDPTGFRGAYRVAEHLLQCMRVGAIKYERSFSIYDE